MAKPVKITSLPGMQLSFIADFGGQGMYRTFLPYTYTNSLSVTNVVFTPSFLGDIGFLNNCYCLRFQRQCKPQHMELFQKYYVTMKRHISHPVKFVYEIDDNVDHLLPDNFAYKEYGKPEKDNMVSMMKRCDVSVFSTFTLKKYYEDHRGVKNGVVLPNLLPKYLWPDPNPENPDPIKRPKILWSGSQSHYGKNNDLEFVFQLIEATCDDFSWIIQGNPSQFHRQLKKEVEHRVQIIPTRDFYTYPRALRDAKADLAIAPLKDNLFNRAKSNLKLLEYTAAGYPSVFSDIDPYQGAPAKIKELDVGLWTNALKRLAEDPKYRINTLRAQQKILSNYWLENPHNFKKWIDVLRP